MGMFRVVCLCLVYAVCFVGVMDQCLCCGISIVWLNLCGNEHEFFSLLGVSYGVCCGGVLF